ncbi:MAG: class I SAM-dependent methyltransferase [Fibrobacterales bacterium]
MDLKINYSSAHKKYEKKSLYLNGRLFNTYNRIIRRLFNKTLTGVHVDLGCGDGCFSQVCIENGVKSFSYDYPEFDLENGSLEHKDESIDFITMNAVFEHIKNPDTILGEVTRVLNIGGYLFIRTPNWKMDFKNFYNDPTHVNPYSPEKLERTLNLAGLKCVFCEPGLIEKKWFWWQLPNSIKWTIAKYIQTKSVLVVGIKE